MADPCYNWGREDIDMHGTQKTQMGKSSFWLKSQDKKK